MTRACARSLLRNRAQARGAAGRAARLGDRAARRRLPARGRRDLLRERAPQGPVTAARRPRRRVGARRGLRDRVRRARRCARPPLGPLGAGPRPGERAARSGSTASRPARADGHRARRALAGRRGAPRHRRARGRDRDAPAATGGFGYDPIFVPDGETRTVAEIGDDWKRRTRIARAPRARSGRGARPFARRRHQLTSAPSTITFAIT